MSAYYNEVDPYAAQWLRNLIGRGLIAAGDVDERSIVDVRPDDLQGYTQAHFFAGLGGWSYAMRLAGWPDDRCCWTGSCPCQPLSGIGKRRGHADERHLWPAFYRLISKCAPAIVFGEQVASRDGREWLAAVRADLEHMGYAVGAADLPAASQGATHIRQRLWFVADLARGRCEGKRVHLRPRRQDQAATISDRNGAALSDADGTRQPDVARIAASKAGDQIGLSAGVDDRQGTRSFRWPPEPDVVRVVHGVSAGMDSMRAQIRAFGNAIVPQVAAEFIKATIGGLK